MRPSGFNRNPSSAAMTMCADSCRAPHSRFTLLVLVVVMLSGSFLAVGSLGLQAPSFRCIAPTQSELVCGIKTAGSMDPDSHRSTLLHAYSV